MAWALAHDKSAKVIEVKEIVQLDTTWWGPAYSRSTVDKTLDLFSFILLNRI